MVWWMETLYGIPFGEMPLGLDNEGQSMDGGVPAKRGNERLLRRLPPPSLSPGILLGQPFPPSIPDLVEGLSPPLPHSLRSEQLLAIIQHQLLEHESRWDPTVPVSEQSFPSSSVHEHCYHYMSVYKILYEPISRSTVNSAGAEARVYGIGERI